MQAKLTTAYARVEVSTTLVRFCAVGARKWQILFDGRSDGRRFNYTTDAIKAVLKAEFDDEVFIALEDQLARPGAIWQLD